jgi:[ribosomal protein S5]-alanine N-acetyltransferase
MPKISIRFLKLSDAKRLYEILNNPNFIYFNVKPKSIEDEKKWLGKNIKRGKDVLNWHYGILYGGKLVGGIGININPRRKFIAEIGYFLDEAFWGKGIMTKAVKLVEKEGFKKFGLSRIEILMKPENKASEKVAIKNGYKKEGLLKKAVMGRDGKKKDAWLYAKVK